MREGEPLREIVEEAVDEALDALPKPRRRDAGVVREAVRRAVRGEIDAAGARSRRRSSTCTHVSD